MSERPGVGTRVMHGCAPMWAGFFIDIVDFSTFGPFGLALGWLIGGAVGWWLAPMLGFPPRSRLIAAVIAGVYCAIPMTEFLPLASFAAGVARVIEAPSKEQATAENPSRIGHEVVDVDFESEDRESR